MRIAVFCSGTSSRGTSPIINAQVNSLISKDIDIDIHPIKEGGISGYLKAILKFRRILKTQTYDAVHAHYSLSGITATLSGAKPVIVSLMGSDVAKNRVNKIIASFFTKYFWDAVIVKSAEMEKEISGTEDKVTIIPNGVNFSHFKPMEMEVVQDQLGWDKDKRHILFAANPAREEKNYSLAKLAYEKLSKEYKNIELHVLNSVPHEEIPLYMNASNIVLLTSKWEGSPNVIKEAMSCDRPIVCTDVGDVAWLFGIEKGHFLTSHQVDDVKKKLESAMSFSTNNYHTNGRERIIKLGLDSDSIAQKIINLYDRVISCSD